MGWLALAQFLAGQMQQNNARKAALLGSVGSGKVENPATQGGGGGFSALMGAASALKGFGGGGTDTTGPVGTGGGTSTPSFMQKPNRSLEMPTFGSMPSRTKRWGL